MDTENRLQVRGLSCIRQQNPLFAHLSFQLNPGEALLIEGQNGSGKSSLLRLLTGLATSSAGEIFWRDQAIQDLRADYWDKLHYVGHMNGIKLGLTVTENLRLTAKLTSAREVQQTEIESVLSLLQLSVCKNIPAKNLSAGQKRRIALAKLFLVPKTLWLLDEPLTALDACTQSIFISQLEAHLQNGGIAVISSHHALELKNDINVRTLRLEPSC